MKLTRQSRANTIARIIAALIVVVAFSGAGLMLSRPAPAATISQPPLSETAAPHPGDRGGARTVERRYVRVHDGNQQAARATLANLLNDSGNRADIHFQTVSAIVHRSFQQCLDAVGATPTKPASTTPGYQRWSEINAEECRPPDDARTQEFQRVDVIFPKAPAPGRNTTHEDMIWVVITGLIVMPLALAVSIVTSVDHAQRARMRATQ